MYKFFHFEAMNFSYHKAQLASAATRFLLNAFAALFNLQTTISTDNIIQHLKLSDNETKGFLWGEKKTVCSR